MTRPILTLKQKKPFPSSQVTTNDLPHTSPQPGIQRHEPMVINVGISQKKQSKPKPTPKIVMDALLDALDRHCAVFIQLRSGAGYRGLPAGINEGWLSLSHATIHGTKNTANVNDVLVQLGDCGQVAHLHIIGEGHSIEAVAQEGMVSHG